MIKYILSESAKEDLIRIHQYGTRRFGEKQADKYFNEFYDYFESITKKTFAFESVDYIRKGYRKCVCGVDTIFFRISNDTVQIIAIIGKQDIDELKNNW
jgi:toxin ParE1/3/4